MFVLYILAVIILLVAGLTWFALFYRVPGSFYEKDGIRLHYRDEGQGIPIVLIHGFAVQADLNWRWAGCIRRLRRAGYRVISVDTRGHGRSSKPHDASAYGVEVVDDVIRLMDHLEIGKAHVAGYSMGGFITLKAITRHPERFHSGIICAAGWGVLDEANVALFAKVVEAIEQNRRFDPLTSWLEPSKKAHPIQCMLANFFMGVSNDLPAIVNVFKTFDGLFVEEEELRRNTVPALTLVGSRDGMREASDRLIGLMTNHDLVYIPGGDHITTILHPQFMRHFMAHLAANSPARESAQEPLPATT